MVSALVSDQIARMPSTRPAAVLAGAAGCEISGSWSITAAFAGSDEKSLLSSDSAGAFGSKNPVIRVAAIRIGGAATASAAPDSTRPASRG